jgi:hypothetical protein
MATDHELRVVFAAEPASSYSSAGHLSVFYVVNTSRPKLHGTGVITGGRTRFAIHLAS